MPFQFKPQQALPDVVLIEPKAFGDDRGWFMETYKLSEFEANGIRVDFHQDNHSRSTTKGVLRGLHYQKDPAAQGKLVRCVVGVIYDVAVDIRKGSPTYGRWVAAELSAENKRQLYIPPGFAHGFCVPDEESEVEYKCTDFYVAEDERGILWNDRQLNITWPVNRPLLSGKDQAFPALTGADLPAYDGGV